MLIGESGGRIRQQIRGVLTAFRRGTGKSSFGGGHTSCYGQFPGLNSVGRFFRSTLLSRSWAVRDVLAVFHRRADFRFDSVNNAARPFGLRSSIVELVLRRPFDMVDYDKINGCLHRGQIKPQLLSQRHEDRWVLRRCRAII